MSKKLNEWAVRPNPINESRKPIPLKRPLEDSMEMPLRKKKKSKKKKRK